MPRGAARDAGLKARHARKEARLTVTCRYIDVVPGGLCGFEAVDPVGEILLCRKHMGRVMELMVRTGFTVEWKGKAVA